MAMIHANLSGDIFLKSRRTQSRLVRLVAANLGAALRSVGHSGVTRRTGGHRLEITAESVAPQEIVDVGRTVFGIGSVAEVVALPASTLEELAAAAAAAAGPAVVGKRFAVRPQRSGDHPWRSHDLAVLLGDLLREAGGSVDLTDPQITVRVVVEGNTAHLTTDRIRGVSGLPLGSQERVLSLVSGGFDSVVATWMMMSRGATADLVHFTLSCAQSDHAMAVAHEMWRRWGHGTDPEVHLVEFQPVKEALLHQVDPSMRQIGLKVLMAQAAAAIADEERIAALVTGDSLGQVSSQTLPHLAAVSRAVDVPVFRPLIGLPKETIISLARTIGTAELSARAQELCDLSEGGRVATAARRPAIARALAAVPDVLVGDAVVTRKTFLLSDWIPGRSTTAG
jgi:thiamine biosynthesis protein ThiI